MTVHVIQGETTIEISAKIIPINQITQELRKIGFVWSLNFRKS